MGRGKKFVSAMRGFYPGVACEAGRADRQREQAGRPQVISPSSRRMVTVWAVCALIKL